jgi:Fic family protein
MIPAAMSQGFNPSSKKPSKVAWAVYVRSRLADPGRRRSSKVARARSRTAGTVEGAAGRSGGPSAHPGEDPTSGAGSSRRPSRVAASRSSASRDASDVVPYCGSGMSACVNLLSRELAGLRGARLCPGSWSDWSTRSDAPVATGNEVEKHCERYPVTDPDVEDRPPFPDFSAFEDADASYEPISDFSEWSTLTVNTQDWARMCEHLQEAREEAPSDDIRRAVETAMRAAAVDTGAIEGLYEVDRGFTFSVAVQAVAWQAAMAKRGSGVRELFDAQLRAYELALDAATNALPITEAWLRSLHEELCTPQRKVLVLTQQGWQEQDLLRGAYKKLPNHVFKLDGMVHSYAPVLNTNSEMHRLVEQLRSTEFLEAHPALQAAYAHYSLVHIHPFQDGNGRVARALASVYMYRSTSVPLVVFSDQKPAYLSTLRQADDGDPRPFADFVLEREIDTMHLVADQLRASPERQLDELRGILTAKGGLSHADLDEIGYQLLSEVETALTDRLSSLREVPGVMLRVQHQTNGSPEPDEGYRQLVTKGSDSALLWGQVQAPTQANVSVTVGVFVAINRDSVFTFRIRAHQLGEPMDVRLEDVHPERREVFSFRLPLWVGTLITDLIRALKKSAADSLRKAGY